MGSSENIHSDTQLLFNEKANFPSLESLTIHNLDNIKSIWHNQHNDKDSFCKLVDVEVRECAKLLKIFPSTMLNTIQSVKKLWIVDCVSLDEVFEVQIGLNLKEITDVTTVSRLRDLYLENLPNLRFVWEKDFHKVLSFEHLWEVDIRECESLKHIFPDFVARNLHQLETLFVVDCIEVETIVDVEVDEDENKEAGEEEVSTTFIFPKLTEVCLLRLPKVECFYPSKHTIEWSAVKELDVRDCNKLSFGELVINDGQNQLEKLLSGLKILTIGAKDMKMMKKQFGHFPEELFLNLRELSLSKFEGDESAAFPSKFLCRLHHLETLQVENSSTQEIFEYEGEGPPVSLPHLTTLKLYKLSELKYIWKEHSHCLIPILEKLDILYITECPHLTNLVPHPTVSFNFLTELEVVDCGGFIKLIQSRTAPSLEQLKMMTISGCQMIEEIVAADDGDHDHDEIIIFSNLEYLKLQELPRLTSFCTDNYTFKFPSLEDVIVIECPNMRTFSPGITITPMLHKVNIDDSDTELWNGDLNTTVQRLFSETETQRLTAADPSPSSSNHHSEPEAQIHDNLTESAANEIEEICEESTSEPREEIEILEQCNDPIGEKLDIPVKGKEKIMIREEDPNCQYQASSSNTSTMPFHGESSVRTEQQVEKSKETVPSSLTLANEPEEQTNAGSNSLLSEEQETKRLDNTDPSTSSNNHSEPEAKQIESSGKEVEEISEESTEPREEGQTRENSTDELAMNESTIEPREQIVDSSLKSNISKKPLPFTQIDPIPFYEVGESSLPSKRQGEKSEETTAAHLDPSCLSPTNEPEEETSAGSLAPPDVVASSLQLSPSSNHLETSSSLVTEAGTSRAGSNSQQNDFQISHVTQELITLLSEIHHLRQTQPLDSMSEEQVHFMLDAFRSLSSMNFSDLFSPYVEKIRERLSSIERNKEISEIDLRIAELKAQMQALEEKKKVLEEKN